MNLHYIRFLRFLTPKGKVSSLPQSRVIGDTGIVSIPWTAIVNKLIVSMKWSGYSEQARDVGSVRILAW